MSSDQQSTQPYTFDGEEEHPYFSLYSSILTTSYPSSLPVLPLSSNPIRYDLDSDDSDSGHGGETNAEEANDPPSPKRRRTSISDSVASFSSLNQEEATRADESVSGPHLVPSLPVHTDTVKENEPRNLVPSLPVHTDTVKETEPRNKYLEKFNQCWEKNYAVYAEAFRRNGHTRITSSRRHRNWLLTQNANYNERKLSDYRIRKLEAIGFVWQGKRKTWNEIMSAPAAVAKWEQLFARLIHYKILHGGSTMVSKSYTKDPMLASWVSEQREHYKGPKMLENREKRLDMVGFKWRENENDNAPPFDPMPPFDEMLGRLASYITKHGSQTPVPKYYEEDVALGVWVQTQRIAKKVNKVPEENITLLNQLNFLCGQKKT